jgi:hypothetical protein
MKSNARVFVRVSNLEEPMSRKGFTMTGTWESDQLVLQCQSGMSLRLFIYGLFNNSHSTYVRSV